MTTPRAAISSADPGSENDRDTSALAGTVVPRGRRIVMPDGPMSSAWHSEIRPAKDFLTAKTAGVRSPTRLSPGSLLRSNDMFNFPPAPGDTQKIERFLGTEAASGGGGRDRAGGRSP